MKLRGICLPLPEVVETVKWGHPTFEAGKKVFAVLDHGLYPPLTAMSGATANA